MSVDLAHFTATTLPIVFHNKGGQTVRIARGTAVVTHGDSRTTLGGNKRTYQIPDDTPVTIFPLDSGTVSVG